MRAIACLLALAAAVSAGGPEVEALVVRLDGPLAADRHAAAEELGRLGPEARAAVPALIDLLGDPESFVRVEAGRALVRIGLAAKDVAPAVRSLETADADAGQLLAEALAGAGAAAVPDLLAATGERVGRTQHLALTALGFLGRDAAAAVPRLIELAADESPATARLAGEALRRAAPWAKDQVPAILGRLAEGPEQVRWNAAYVLGRIGPAARDALPLLRMMLEDESPRLREAAADALRAIDVVREPAAGAEALRKPALANEQAPERFRVRFETTRGAFVVEVERAWAPKGADRLWNLVKAGFFQEVAFFRVVPGFVAQFGLHDDPKVRTAWKDANIEDDPVKQSNRRGTLCFATAGPGTRTTQLFLSLGDNAFLDRQGFSPVGRVAEGMDVVDALYPGYREQPRQDRIHYEGNAYLKREFPKLDYIRKATIEK